jgi:hypothetical protein
MTQGEFYYLIMAVGALAVFAVALAYGAFVAPGKPHTVAEITPLPKKAGAAGRSGLNTGTKEAA